MVFCNMIPDKAYLYACFKHLYSSPSTGSFECTRNAVRMQYCAGVKVPLARFFS